MDEIAIIGKLAEDVARGVYANDAEFFQREFNKILRIAKRNAVDAPPVLPSERSAGDDKPPVGTRIRFPKPENAIGKCWEVVNMLYCGLPREAEVHGDGNPDCRTITKGQPMKPGESEIENTAQQIARAIAEAIRDDDSSLVKDIEFLSNWQEEAVSADETIVDRVIAGLVPIITTEFSALAETPRAEAFQWIVDVVPQWWKDAIKDSGATIDVSTGTVYIAGIRIAGRGDYILKVNGKLHGVPKVVYEALDGRLTEDDVEAALVKLGKKRPYNWISVERKSGGHVNRGGMVEMHPPKTVIIDEGEGSIIGEAATLAEALSAAVEGNNET